MRLIDADRLFDAMRRIKGQFVAGVGEVVNTIDVFEQIKDAPTIDAIEVVRCKDCYYAEEDITHMFCVYFHHKVYEDDYCSNAVERKVVKNEHTSERLQAYFW